MRANTAPSPARSGKRRLLESCAITASLAALAYGGPALAQVQANPVFVNVGAGTSVGSNSTTKTTTVNLTQAQSIINWIPTDTAPTGGDINLLPADSTWNFNGSGNYIVLNRFVNGAGGALSRQIALSGTINSTNSAASGAQGGSIWFYNAGGILINNGAAINVGSLVLTTNDVLTTGGLLGPSGTIRFRGASGSTSTITNNGNINAAEAFNAGSAYVALVAPRVVQAGNVSVDGSAAYVAAEQVDIRTNNGLFDINVLVGAEGGNVITHTGNTTGPAHQQGDTDQNRIYMVAIPKNDAVTMLVRGAIGYDDALSAQVDPDGAVRLSAGYNITGGELDAAPANATAASITVTDTLFRSSVFARASSNFVAQPISQLPGLALPFAPPPGQGRVFVQGSGTFIGDASATFNIGTGQLGGALGNLTVQSGGVGGTAGNAAVNVSGGTLIAGSGLTVQASGQVDALTGDSQGGTASLNITGGTVSAAAVTVEANGIADVGTNGAGGDGRGGTASISVSNAGSTLTAGNIFINALGRGDGTFNLPSGAPAAVDNGGDGQGGTATLTVANGGTVGPVTLLSLDARGIGAVGLVQSGSGTGGTARVQLSGAGSLLSVLQQTFVQAGGDGGANVSSPFGTFLTQNGGDAVGGTAEVILNADATATASLGAVGISALARGGGASAGENAVGGDALGGTASVTATGGVNAQASSLTLNASAAAGGSGSPSGTTGQTGNARANAVTLSATNGSSITSGSDIRLFAVGMGTSGENFANGTGGNVVVNAASGGTVSAANQFLVQAMGGGTSSSMAQSSGNGTGGNADFVADGGTIRAESYDVDVSASTVNVTGAGGTAQGGTIDLVSQNGGQLLATIDSPNFFDAGATTGVSADGTSATGGTIQMIANAGTINMAAGAVLTANGVSGGATSPGTAAPSGIGGTVLIRVGTDANSLIRLGSLDANADGRTSANFEAFPGIPRDTAGNGQGGTVTVEILGGTLASGGTSLSASGTGGNSASGRTGTGGTATFTQTAGIAQLGSVSLSADGFGGSAAGISGNGIGGTSTMTLSGGTFDAGSVSVSADGLGGFGIDGDDFNPSTPVPSSEGGTGRGGTATINVDGTAVVNAALLGASAFGSGGGGGDFFSANGSSANAANGGQGVGGTATVNLVSGSVFADAISADSGGSGGSGGDTFSSSSSGTATGLGVGGTGGAGSGGTSVVNFDGASVTVSESVTSQSSGFGGSGGSGSQGGAGGNATGGLAQAIVNNYDPGALAVLLDTTASGGTGGYGNEGAGGVGGAAQGGISRIQAVGPGATLVVSQDNFATTGTGGTGGIAGGNFFGGPVGARGGDGGTGTGGTIEIVAADGGTVNLGGGGIIARSGASTIESSGLGGDGGDGAYNAYTAGRTGGDGGNGGAGVGGTVRLLANGGTITSGGAAVAIVANGTSGTGGLGGSGLANTSGVGGNGANGGSYADTGGRVILQSLATPAGPGQIALGATTINANGFNAGRIEILGNSIITMSSLTASALGFAAPTNNDTDEAPAGIFVAATGGTISVTGDASLSTGSSVGVYGQGVGRFDVSGNLTIQSGDQVDLRHSLRGESTAPTIVTGGDMAISAVNSISGAPGTQLTAGGTLTLATTGPNGLIGVDRLEGTDIVMTTVGAASVEHAEAANDFTATAGSFRTGLNSIITGGDILVNALGAVDLGNSSAGGSVSVTGQSIVFNAIDAGLTVGLNATGDTVGAEGIRGGSITAGGDTTLFGNSIALTGTVTGTGSFFAFGTGGDVAVNQADVDGTISIFTAGNLTGTYVAGGDVRLNALGNVDVSATASGGYVDPNGIGTEGNLYVEAGGNVVMANSAAARMFGVNAGGSAAITGGTAGEDFLVGAGTTATLTNITAGDDVNVFAPGDITATNVRTTGAGGDTNFLIHSSSGGFTITQGEGVSSIDGADLVLASSAGAINATGLSAGDDIALTAAGAVSVNGATTLGLGTTGGDSSVAIQAASANATGINAFDNVSIATTGTTTLTGTVAAGRNVTITADAATANAITAGGDLTATTSTGAAALGTVNAGGGIVVAAATDITGAYSAGGDVLLTAGRDVTASANAAGTAVNANGAPYEGNVLVDAGRNVVLTDSGAARMFGVNAGGSAAITGATAGEDLFVLAGTTAALTNVTAGDDVDVRATGDITVSNVRTTGAGPDDRTLGYAAASGFAIATAAANGADITLTSGGSVGASVLSAGDDVAITATGTTALTGAVAAARNVAITSNAVTIAPLTNSGGSSIDTVIAGGNIGITSATNIGGGGSLRAAGNVGLNGAAGILADRVTSGGTTNLVSANGNIDLGSLNSVGDVDTNANAIRIGSGGALIFNTLVADTGDAVVRNSGNLLIRSGTVAGNADIQSSGSNARIDALTANNATLAATGGSLRLGDVTAANNLDASADGLLQIAGVVTGRNVALGSADITIDAAARVGTAGTTQNLSVANNDNSSPTYVGGTGTRSGFHIDANEMTRLFGTAVEIFAPEVAAISPASVGSSAPPDVIVDSFTFTGGAAGSNLGANGSLTIRTPGKMRVIGNVQLTGLADTNSLNLNARDALEVILGQGSVRLVNGTAPAGRLNMVSDDIIVATAAAITDVGAATTTDAIETRLAQNDGVVLDEGALFARGITFDVIGGVYVQNSGAGTKFGERRGLTFGAGGLDILTEDASTRIVINGVQLGATGQVTGLDTIPLLTIGGAQATTLVPGSFDPRSTFNGCVIANAATCSLVTFDRLFPVQDVIDDVVDSDDDPKGDGSDGGNLPSTALITTRDLDPLSGEPLLDDPVTGAGNDDLWTPTTDTPQP